MNYGQLETKRLILRKFESSDLDFIYNHFQDEFVSRYLYDNEPPRNRDEARGILDWCRESSPDHIRWCIVLKETEIPVGTIGFHRYDGQNNSAEIGYDLSEEYAGRGLMSEALRAIIAYGEKELNLHRIHACVAVENLASNRLLQSNGFMREGVVRDQYLYRGEYYDHYLWSIIPPFGRMASARPSLANWLSLSGVLAGLFYFLHILYGTRYYPGYDSMTQAVSDLTALGAPSYFIATRFTALYGALTCLCCTILSLMIKGEKSKTFRSGIYLYALMNGISFIGYTLFPLSGEGFGGTFQDIMHFYVVTLSVVLLSIVSLILIAAGGLRTGNHRVLGIGAILALVCLFIGSIGVGAMPAAVFGLFERFCVFSVVIYAGVLGIWGFRQRS